MTSNLVKQWFATFSRKGAQWSAHPVGFALAVGLIVGWAASGPLFRYSDTWQLVINTTTTVITFLMVFVIQNTQNRDAVAMHLKLDEIILAVGQAHNALIDLEDLGESDLAVIRERYTTIGAEARADGIESVGGASDSEGAPMVPRPESPVNRNDRE